MKLQKVAVASPSKWAHYRARNRKIYDPRTRRFWKVPDHDTGVGGLWNDPASWRNGMVPKAGQNAIIETGRTILLNTQVRESIGVLGIYGGALRRDGAMYADLHAHSIFVDNGGSLLCGDPRNVYRGLSILTLTGKPLECATSTRTLQAAPVLGNAFPRSVIVASGSWKTSSNTRDLTWLEISDHITASGTSAIIDGDISGWNVGDWVAIAPTDWYSLGGTVHKQLTGIDLGTNTISWSGGVDFRWGKTQYATDSGLSLSPGTFTAPSGTPTTLNERAVVANLSRNTIIQSINDAYWTDDGFGMHTMIYGAPNSVDAVIDGEQFRKGGQAGILARYPFHWHQKSYYPDGHAQEGEYKGAVPAGTGVLRNCAIWESSQRMVVIHATDGVTVTRNVGYDIKAHAIFTEGANEVDNTITYNCVLKVRGPMSGKALLLHDIPGGDLGAGPTAFWQANPQNVVNYNYAADVDGPGFWNAFPTQCWGDMTSVDMAPNTLFVTEFTGNRSQSNRGPGLLGRQVQIDSAGNLANIAYSPGVGGGGPFELSYQTLTKNGYGAYGHYTGNPTYLGFATANNFGKHFAGKTDVPNDAILASAPNRGVRKGLIVGYSLNDANPDDPSPVETLDINPVSGVTSYHSTLPSIENTYMHIPTNITASGYGNGAHATEDYYANGSVERGTYFDQDNQYIDAVPAFRHPAPNKNGQAWCNASAILDHAGNRWGTPYRYNVYNYDFFTYGLTTSAAPYDGSTENGRLVATSHDGGTEFYSVGLADSNAASWAAEIDGPGGNWIGDAQAAAMSWIRYDAIGGTEIDTWGVDNGTVHGFGIFHSAAVARDAVVLYDFPEQSLATMIKVSINNCWREGDGFILGIRFDCADDTTVTYGNNYYPVPGSVDCTEVFTAAEVASGDGTVFYKDTTNNIVWLKIKGDLVSAYGASEFTWSRITGSYVVVHVDKV